MAPKQKDKYSDQQLDPSEQAFDNIVSHPDMQALDDQGDSIARDTETANNLKDAEDDGLRAPDDFYEGKRRNNRGDNKRRKEAADWNNPDNAYYRPSDKVQNVIDGTWSNRKKGTVGGLIAATIGGIIIAILMTLPLKVPGLLSLVTNETAQKLQNVTEKRAKLIIGRAILSKIGTNTGVVLTGEGAFATLVASMRTANFEKKLAKQGLTIIRDGDGVKLDYKGKPLGDGKTFRNEKAIMEAIDADALSRQMIDDIVKEEIPAWRLMKKVKFAKWLRIKYGIPKYGLKNSTAEKDEDRIKEMDTERAKSANGRTTRYFSEIITCLMSGGCEKVNNASTDPSEGSVDDANSTPADLDESVSKTEEEIAKGGIKTLAETLPKKLLTLFGSKAIPIVGWIDLVATFDHMVYDIGKNDYLGKIAAYYKGAQYAAIYAEWAGYSSQVQLGAMDPVYVGALADSLNDAERAQAYQAIQGNPEAGKAIEVTVDSDRPSNIKVAFDNFVNNTPEGKIYKNIGHPIANAYYETVGGGGIIGWLGEGIGGLAAGIAGWVAKPFEGPLTAAIGALTPDSLKQAALDAVSSFGPFLFKSFGLTIDALDKGAGLFNNIMGGSVVSTNEYSKEIGLRKLTAKQTYEQTIKIAAERNEYRQQKGLAYALFSSDEPRSLTNQLVASAPSSPNDAIVSLANLVMSAPAKLATMVAPRSSAANAVMYESLFHVQPYGATTEDLARPLSPTYLGTAEGSEGTTTCPEVTDGDFNDCNIDKEVTEAMICIFTPDTPECSDTDPSTEGGFDFRLSSFNALDGVAHAGESRAVAGGNCSDNECMQRRTDNAVKMIKNGTDIGNKGIDLIGMQEVSDPQYEMFKKALPDYGSYPNDTKGEANQRMIMWNTDKLEFVKGGTIEYPWYGSSTTPMTWVQLQAAGGSVYLYNVHLVAGQYPGENRSDEKRARGARIILEDIKKRVTDGSAVFITGDMNAQYTIRPEKDDRTRDELPYCIFTKDGSLSNTLDLFKGRSGHCPNKDDVHHIDHAYASSDVTVTHWAHVETGVVKRATDHDGILVTDVRKEAPAGAPIPYKNAVFNGNIPDPSVIRGDDKRYHVYATGNKLQHLVSKDLVHWSRANGAIVTGAPASATGEMWAPDVQKTGDHFTMTYAGSGGGGNFDIYYATSASAAGPFKFRGLLVSGGYTSKYDLDPNIYMSSGGPILYYGSGTQGITAVKLSIAADGTIQTTGAKKIILDVNPTTEWIAEGAWMQKHDNYYYLYYSVGRYDFSAPSRPAYHVRVARSTNPMGPFEKSNKPVIEGNAAFLRPGHNSITTDNAGAEWMVYHAYESPNRSDRKLMIDPITYTGGWPIVRDGHPSVGIQQDGPANGADGGSLTTGKGGWIWPLKKGVNDGPCYGGPRVHAGMDMNSKTTNNPVYAMHDGTVSRTVDQGARGGGTYIIIKATGAGANYNGKPVFYGLQHLVPGSRTAKEGDKVKVGQKIGIAGHSGNVSLGASKAHLHVTMSSSNSVGEYGNLGDTFDPMNILKDAGKAPEGYKCYNG